MSVRGTTKYAYDHLGRVTGISTTGPREGGPPVRREMAASSRALTPVAIAIERRMAGDLSDQ
jgi:hypothetical protein